MMTPREAASQISKDTLLPLGYVVLVITAVIWISSQLHVIDMRLMTIENTIGNTWSAKDQTIWAQKLQINNPDIRVPDPCAVVDERQGLVNRSH